MTIAIRQSDLNRVGCYVDFPRLSWTQRRNTAIRLLLSIGREREARLLEINNPNAVAGVIYVADAIPNFARMNP